MSKIIMKQAAIEDVSKVGDLYNLVTLYQNEHGNYTSWKHKIYPRLEDAKDSFDQDSLFVFYADETLIGSVVLDHNSHTGYKDGQWIYNLTAPTQALVIHRLALSPQYLRKGYGVKMMEAILDYAREKGIPTVRLDTTSKNVPAKGLYEKVGFQKCGITTLDFVDRGAVEVQLYEYVI